MWPRRRCAMPATPTVGSASRRRPCTTGSSPALASSSSASARPGPGRSRSCATCRPTGSSTIRARWSRISATRAISGCICGWTWTRRPSAGRIMRSGCARWSTRRRAAWACSTTRTASSSGATSSSAACASSSSGSAVARAGSTASSRATSTSRVARARTSTTTGSQTAPMSAGRLTWIIAATATA